MISPSAISPLNRRVVEGFDALNLNWDVYYNADNVIESGGLVSQITDLSGNNNHASQGVGAAQPTYTTNPNFNNKNVISFATNDYMPLNNGIDLNVNDFVIFWIVDDNGLRPLFQDGFAFGDPLVVQIAVGLGMYYHTTSTTKGPIPTSPPRRILTILKSGTTYKVYVNGTLTTTFVQAATPRTIQQLQRPSDGGGIWAQFSVRLNSLTTDQLNQIGNFLANYYGFTWTTII